MVNEHGPRARPGVDEEDEGWRATLVAIRSPGVAVPAPWDMVYGPLQDNSSAHAFVIGQIGQSLDGRIATSSGHSHYINGAEALIHLHRLRALVDAVVVGVGTVLADDPQLTVRRIPGPHPVRVIIDPKGRVPRGARALADDGVRCIILGGETCAGFGPGVEARTMLCEHGRIEPRSIVRELAAQGLRRILVEGGARTISGFLQAGCLDRLHVMVAPLILGSGPAGIVLPPIDRLNDAIRPRTRVHQLGCDMLFDCDLRS
jgi:riboflavin-specific deaminase-like protein